MNWLDQLYNFRDAVQNLWNNPHALLDELRSNHILLVEVLAVLVVFVVFLYILIKPSKKKQTQRAAVRASTLQKASSRVEVKEALKEPKLELPVQKDTVIKTVKAVQEEARQRQIQKQQETRAKEKVEGPWQDLTTDEERALAEAMETAGKQALAEVGGAPHQVEFFEEESAARDAARKMFSKTRTEVEDASAMQMPLKKAAATPRLDFLMIYYMAPRSQTYKVFNLFKIFEDFNLYFNEDSVFEYSDQQGLQFYIASAIKPGTFDVSRQGDIPGLSFIIDLQRVSDGRGAFNKMLIFIDALSKQLKGDILDERRQRMTTPIMNEYLARIKSFNNIYK